MFFSMLQKLKSTSKLSKRRPNKRAPGTNTSPWGSEAVRGAAPAAARSMSAPAGMRALGRRELCVVGSERGGVVLG